MRNIYVVLTVLLCAGNLYGEGNLTSRLSKDKAVKRTIAVVVASDTDASVKWADIKDNLDIVGAASDVVQAELDAIDMTSLTNGVWTGTQKVYCSNMKDIIQSLKLSVRKLNVATKNLQQAALLEVKKQKAMKRVQQEVSK